MKSLCLLLALFCSVSLIQIKRTSIQSLKQDNIKENITENGILEVAVSTEVQIESISIDSKFIDISSLSQLKPLTVGSLQVTIKPNVEIKINLSAKTLSLVKPSAFLAKISYETKHNRERIINSNADWFCNNESAKSYGQSPDKLNNIVLIKMAEFIWSKQKEDSKVSCSIVTPIN